VLQVNIIERENGKDGLPARPLIVGLSQLVTTRRLPSTLCSATSRSIVFTVANRADRTQRLNVLNRLWRATSQMITAGRFFEVGRQILSKWLVTNAEKDFASHWTGKLRVPTIG
jgi:hypothetical protein